MRDIYGDHAVSCVSIVGFKHRHNVVRDTLVDICFRSEISAGKEVDIRLGGGRDKSLRLADMLLYSWDCGFDVCVDLTGSSPLTQTGMVDFVPGRAVIEAAQRKCVKYKAKCADIGYGFLPFSFSSFGELDKDVVTLLKRIRKFSVSLKILGHVLLFIFLVGSTLLLLEEWGPRYNLCDGHYTAAVRVLSSSGVAPYNDATLEDFKAKHPLKHAPPCHIYLLITINSLHLLL
ncbi:hypothetical protein Tco_0248017 [Tanacetum coccineum]